MSKELKLTVLKVRQPIGDFYIASISAQDLVDISFSDVRRLAKDQRDLEKYLGIQRPVSPKRIKEIKQYIEGEDSTFPTSVILAVDEKCAEYDSSANGIGTLILKEYQANATDETDSIPYSKIAKVIDGQHRIAAFMDENNNWCFDYGQRDFDINVAIFIGADVSEQANIFATVNLAQTKVNKSLVYDLTELAKTPSPHKTCHNVAVALDKEPSSPLHHRIKRLGTATPGRKKEPLTQASFVESLVKFISPNPVQDRNDLLAGKRIKPATGAELQKFPFRNLFLEEKEIDITEIIYNYFKAVEKKWPDSWNATDRVGNLLPRSNAFKAFMIYLREDAYPALAQGNYGLIPSVNDFYKKLDHIELKDDDFTTRNFAPGSGGQATFLKMLRGEISLEDMLDG
ncbi:TPA: DGQHR domain-containing protein [Pseudomonas aeruginosa]|uniref:DGQHR domain-containing protein n=1 Tax=Pseudomonas aeruginosa TaxID=287 RepID=UPI00157B6804|nr:DGQHR domain-containing protein [Pseudomonas aeruginosa]MDP5424391.1 DGQHR domain-containing protein [Pseudomonas aeruginosa]HBO2483040.1 DGQHR domain-containing protein [Pseudomonas aeruginosa]HBP6616131.1 DGQHR domain-containing protein [Pseudomonas aeruginosa]HCK7375965.1 DGQHR domain-containing protein [Pseudomonas aeruginosa]HDV4085075.1 DGQHR domain-containing protein [Pseudomonas aeruginosa]